MASGTTLGYVREFPREERWQASDQDDCFVAGEASNFVGGEECAALGLAGAGVGALPALGLGGVGGLDGLAAEGFGDVVAGVGVRGAEEEDGVAVADDGLHFVSLRPLGDPEARLRAIPHGERGSQCLMRWTTARIIDR